MGDGVCCEVFQVVSSQHLKQLTSCVEGLQEAGQGAGLPYRSLSHVLHCSLITLLRDTVTSCTLRESHTALQVWHYILTHLPLTHSLTCYMAYTLTHSLTTYSLTHLYG